MIDIAKIFARVAGAALPLSILALGIQPAAAQYAPPTISAPYEVAEQEQGSGQASRLIRLVLRLLGDLGTLRLGVDLGNRVDLAPRPPVAPTAACRRRAHSPATSSRSSASFCKKTTSSQPNSAISA